MMMLAATPVVAQESATAYEALRTVGAKLNRDAVNHIISVTGVDGAPQPETWKVLLDDKRAPGGARELEVSNGRIVSESNPAGAVVGTAEGATINTALLESRFERCVHRCQPYGRAVTHGVCDRQLRFAYRRTEQPDLDRHVAK